MPDARSQPLDLLSLLGPAPDKQPLPGRIALEALQWIKCFKQSLMRASECNAAAVTKRMLAAC